MRRLVYISGKISGGGEAGYEEQKANVELARQFALEAWKIPDTYIYTPHLNSPWNTDTDIEIAFKKVFGGEKRNAHDLILDADLSLLRRVDVMVMMDNWVNSKGAIMEHECAKEHRIPIVYGIEELKKYMKSRHRHCAVCKRLRKKLQKIHNTQICRDCEPVVAEIVKYELNKDAKNFLKVPKMNNIPKFLNKRR